LSATRLATHVAFVRAINVRGHPTVRAAELTRAFAAAGAEDPRTVMQSGNVIFGVHGGVRGVLEFARSSLARSAGDEIVVVARSHRDLRAIVERAPFGALETDPRVKLYVAFLSAKPRRAPRLPLRLSREELTLVAVDGPNAYVVSRRKPSGFYGFPNNFVEDVLGATATTRNWSTVKRLLGVVASRERAP
jgi:uncharacterized protein (DUF1697 family)